MITNDFYIYFFKNTNYDFKRKIDVNNFVIF